MENIQEVLWSLTTTRRFKQMIWDIDIRKADTLLSLAVSNQSGRLVE